MRSWVFSVWLVIFSLGGAAFAQTTVTFWYSVGGDPLDTLIGEFNASQDNIIVEGVNVGNYNEMIQRLQAAVVSGRIPDMVQLEITRYGIFADRGVLIPLSDLIETTPEFMVDDLIPGIWEAAQYRGVPYVIPFNNSTPVMYYNKALFAAAGLDPENPPTNWQELRSAALALTVRDDAGNTSQWGMSGPPQWVRHSFVRSNGGDWMDDELTRLTLNEAEAIEAYQYLYDLIHDDQVAYAEASIDANESLARQDFVTGRTAIFFGSTGSLGGLLQDVEFDLGVAPLMCNVACGAPIGGATAGIMAGVSQEQQQAAWDFIVWLTNTENNAFFHTATGYMPIRQSTLEAQTSIDFYEQNPEFWVAIEQFQQVSFPRPRPPAMPAIRELELTAWEEIVTGSKSVQQALDDLAREADALLAAE